MAIALSDELHINELNAGVLLYQARTRAAHRPDHDVALAAIDLFYLHRRQNILFLQEILRAGLLTTVEGQFQGEDNFVAAVMRERDVLVVEHKVFENVHKRLTEGMRPENKQSPGPRNPRALQKGEAVLLAETLFLLAYTVQLTAAEAIALRTLLHSIDGTYETAKKQEIESTRLSRSPLPFEDADKKSTTSEIMSRGLAELECVRNLIFLAWTSAIDRARYHDIYDPRTGNRGVNALLKDLSFIPRTIAIPKLEDNEANDKVGEFSQVKAAAELCAAVFRLAVANPDEQEALFVALRVSSFGGALSFLSEELSDWIGKRAGSICPDTDLYADVLEDLALDVAEAPQLVSSLIQFTQNEVLNAASELAYAPFEQTTRSTERFSGIQSVLSRMPLSRGPSISQSGTSPSHRRSSGVTPCVDDLLCLPERSMPLDFRRIQQIRCGLLVV